MALLIVASALYAMCTGKWQDFVGALPFAFLLTPIYPKVHNWALSHKYPMTMLFLLLFPMSIVSAFLYMGLTSNWWNATMRTIPFIVCGIVLGGLIYLKIDKNR